MRAGDLIADGPEHSANVGHLKVGDKVEALRPGQPPLIIVGHMRRVSCAIWGDSRGVALAASDVTAQVKG